MATPRAIEVRSRLFEIAAELDKTDELAEKYELNVEADALRSELKELGEETSEAVNEEWAEQASRKNDQEVDYELAKDQAYINSIGASPGF